MRPAWLAIALPMSLVACGDNIDGNLPAPPSCLPDCAASRDYDATSYHLAGAWDWDSTTLTASETIVLDTSASGPIVELDSHVNVTNVHAGLQDLAFVASPTTLHVDLSPVDDGTFTVEYTVQADGSQAQQAGTALLIATSDDGDPVRSRVVFTDSEPNRASLWMATKVDPSDRALWSVELTIDPREDAIANGERTGDAMVDGKRVVSYSLDKPIPSYMMAWATGQLQHVDRDAANGLPPTSVWFRTGMVLDPNLTLDHVADAMTTFQSLLGVYPWHRYSVVLLPYGGGMENATITFDSEFSGQGPGSFELTAHELGHHWFGDFVTMHTFDDVWFKEGMATVLEIEAKKHVLDQAGVGRKFGRHMFFNPDDAIVDDTLHGLDKYTTGPYARAGWVIEQIRQLVGEDTFWESLRGFLAAHEYDSATGEQFVRSFPLTEEQVQAVLAVLPEHNAPALHTTTNGDEVTFAIVDPAHLFLAPYEVDAIDSNGVATATTLSTTGPTTITVPAGGYLALDPGDWQAPVFDFTGFQGLSLDQQLLTPPDAPAVIAAFDRLSPATQEDAVPALIGTELTNHIAALDSDDAKTFAIVDACQRGQTDAVKTLLVSPPSGEFQDLTSCDRTFAMTTLEPALMSALASGTPADLARVEYLLSFDYGADEDAILQGIAQHPPTYRLQLIAQERSQFGGGNGPPGHFKRGRDWCRLHGTCGKR